ncbi:hypothetical protein D3C76_1038350 [compost metagenome]
MAARHIGGQGAEVIGADVEDEGRCPVAGQRAGHVAITADRLQPVVPGPRLAPHRQDGAIRQGEGPGDAPRRAPLHHLGQGIAQGIRHLDRQHPSALDVGRFEHGGEGRVLGKREILDALGRGTYTPVLDDPHQLGQCRRSVPRAAECRRQRRHQVIERITQPRPALMDVEEGFDLQHGTDAAIPGAAMAGLEQPAVHFLALITAGRDRIGEGRLVELLEVGEQPQLQRVHPRYIALIR